MFQLEAVTVRDWISRLRYSGVKSQSLPRKGRISVPREFTENKNNSIKMCYEFLN